MPPRRRGAPPAPRRLCHRRPPPASRSRRGAGTPASRRASATGLWPAPAVDPVARLPAARTTRPACRDRRVDEGRPPPHRRAGPARASGPRPAAPTARTRASPGTRQGRRTGGGPAARPGAGPPTAPPGRRGAPPAGARPRCPSHRPTASTASHVGGVPGIGVEDQAERPAHRPARPPAVGRVASAAAGRRHSRGGAAHGHGGGRVAPARRRRRPAGRRPGASASAHPGAEALLEEGDDLVPQHVAAPAQVGVARVVGVGQVQFVGGRPQPPPRLSPSSGRHQRPAVMRDARQPARPGPAEQIAQHRLGLVVGGVPGGDDLVGPGLGLQGGVAGGAQGSLGWCPRRRREGPGARGPGRPPGPAPWRSARASRAGRGPPSPPAPGGPVCVAAQARTALSAPPPRARSSRGVGRTPAALQDRLPARGGSGHP